MKNMFKFLKVKHNLEMFNKNLCIETQLRNFIKMLKIFMEIKKI